MHGVKTSLYRFYNDFENEFFGEGMSNNSLAAGVAFTLKALLLVGVIALIVWCRGKKPDYSNTDAVEYFRAETGADDGTGASRLVTH